LRLVNAVASRLWEALRGHGRAENRPAQVQPAQVRQLYKYSNYLTPRASAFSHDSFLFATTYFHHFLFNLTILFFTFAFVLMLPRVGLWHSSTSNTGSRASVFWRRTSIKQCLPIAEAPSLRWTSRSSI